MDSWGDEIGQPTMETGRKRADRGREMEKGGIWVKPFRGGAHSYCSIQEVFNGQYRGTA